MRKPPARAIASRRGMAQWCSMSSSAAAESGARLHALLALHAEADQRTDGAPELPGLVVVEIAHVGDLELAVGVLVDGQRVDHADGAVLLEPLELRGDLTVELGVVEAQHDELDGPDCHVRSSGRMSSGAIVVERRGATLIRWR